MHARIIRPSSRRNPSIEPTTIPAIAPPLRPFPSPLDAPALALLVGEEVGLAVEEKTSAIEEKTGSVTSWQRPSASEVKQHESVAFSVLARQ